MPKKHNNINKSFASTIIFSGVVLILIAFLLIKLELVTSWIGMLISALRPVIIGIVIMLVMHTPARRLEMFLQRITKGKRFPCSIVAIILSYLALFTLLGTIIGIVVPQVSQSVVDFADQFTLYFINFQKFLQGISHNGQDLYELMEQVGLDFAQIKSWLTDFSVNISSYVPNLMGKIGIFATSLVGVIVDCFIGLIFSIYMLLGKNRLKSQAKRILKKVFSESRYQRVTHYGKLTFEIFSNFIGGKLLDSFIVGLLCFIGMSIFRFQYPILISVIIGLTNIIPVVGPFIGAIPSALILLLVEPKQAVWFIVFVIVLQQIDGNLIGPRIIGGSVGLPAIWTLFAIVVGGNLFGILGILLGIPIMSLIYVILREKTLPEGEIPPSPLQVPEKTPMEQRANEWLGKMRDTVFTTVTDTVDTVKHRWHHDTNAEKKETDTTFSETIDITLQNSNHETEELDSTVLISSENEKSTH
jgi:predicted PurR-regulated permease PerM